MFCSEGAFHSCPSFHCHEPSLASFCPSSPWIAFAGSGQFLAQWPRCPHFRQTSLSVFPLPLPSCQLCPWNPFPWSCSCFASSPSRGDRMFHTCDTSCHRVAAVRRSPSVLCSSHGLHDASGKLPTLLPLHARHPQALVERGPTSGISQNSTASASQALCPSLGSEQSPHASHPRSSFPRLARMAPDRAHAPRAS